MCGQCQFRRIECDFSAPKSEDLSSWTLLTSDTVRADILATLVADETRYRKYVEPAGWLWEDGLSALDHFATSDTPWLGSPNFQHTLQRQGIRLALKASYLLHAIIAISAGHVSALNPVEGKHCIGSMLHYQRSLDQYYKVVGERLDEEDADAVFAASILHAMLAFTSTPSAATKIPLAAECTSDGPTWMMSMQGVRSLLATKTFRARLETGIWISVVQEIELMGAQVVAQKPSITGWCTYAPLLDHTNRSSDGHENIDRFIAYIAYLPAGLIDSLKRTDRNALLILYEWCTCFGRIEQWWITASVRSECRRLQAHLEQQ